PGARKRRASDDPILVCGGAGFLGSHLCARLVHEGKRVVCLDNFCTSDEEAIRHLLTEPGFALMRADVASFDDSSFAPVSAIYNLACAASPIHYQRDPLETLFASVHGMERLLRLARRDKVRIFQAS